MKKTFLIILLFSLSACLTEPKKDKIESVSNKTNNKLKENKGFDLFKLSAGKYPSDINLFDNPEFIERLKKLIGNKYNFVRDYWSVETPIEFKNGIYILKGCEKHNCNWTNFILTYEVSNNHLSAGIRDEKKVKIFSEKIHHPNIIDEWKKKE